MNDPTKSKCEACKAQEVANDPDTGAPFCPECESKYPASLLKSIIDDFDYALGLRTGERIRFSSAMIYGEWVHLIVINEGLMPNPCEYIMERGLDVRIADIAWCADAPAGS